MLIVRDALLRSISGRAGLWQPVQDLAGPSMLSGQAGGDKEVHRALEQLLVGNVQVGA